MAYRSGTYVAFHANNTSEPTESDMKYYNLLKAWDSNEDFDFHFVDSHDKAGAVRDSSKKATLEATLKERLRNSKNMILVIGETTKEDTDWVPMEISYAIDQVEIPIIAAYPKYDYILAPDQLSGMWPYTLKTRIENKKAHVIHIPFRQKAIMDAISQFAHDKYPNNGGLGYYSAETYQNWGYKNK